MNVFGNCYQGEKVLITGHTGFKGSWLSCWLKESGAEVFGVALPPDSLPNHWELLKLDMPQHLLDIRDAEALSRTISGFQPKIVFHLAAQPLVRKSYRDPLDTWSTNVLGTANLLEACRKCNSVRAIVIITTDKVYENREWACGYREDERLGGHDPYSASKAAAELVVDSYRKSYFSSTETPLVATARAGNVIGGGDWSEDRLVPDLFRAISRGEALVIRSPKATRPWQHVLECLSGYLLLGQMLLEGKKEFECAWNFGPDQDGNISVEEMLARLSMHWPETRWHITPSPQPHEASLLYLDSTKARTMLGWNPVWNTDNTLRITAEWYRGYLSDGRIASRAQLAAYLDAARAAGLAWSGV